MSRLLLTFYGDDFTGSTDALEQLTLADIRAVLFIEPPTKAQLGRFPRLQAVGVAGTTRALTPVAMERELVPALKKLKTLGARHVHYKVCSTFDSSPEIGSIGCLMEIGARIFKAPFIPILAAAPALGRFTIFGTHFARYGIGSEGEIYRLDRHPSISRHPVTPMTEADLRLHLARQTRMKVGLFDIMNLNLPAREARLALGKILLEKPEAILFDALNTGHLKHIGALIDSYAGRPGPLFSIGSSGVETALAAHVNSGRGHRENAQIKNQNRSSLRKPARAQVLIGSGSCSPVTTGQIEWALKNGFAEVTLDAIKLAMAKNASAEIHRAVSAGATILRANRNIIIHTTRGGANRRVALKLGTNTAFILGDALGRVLRGIMAQCPVRRICVAGGDTSGFAARAMGVQALEMIAPLTPGAPLCRASAPGSPVDGCELVFKGGQVGAENYFEILKRGSA